MCIRGVRVLVASMARFQPDAPDSNPVGRKRFVWSQNVKSELEALWAEESVLVALKWYVVLLLRPETVSQ